ncbi:3-hydroxyisobutyrate dehydrogenase [Lentzea xinjiangensis]|uniref:3-hydroxyisobutyrate dehydrogenase n=1 Tax=Lentzea xinjiangensis TaxID=402600 RepID=A0A1H9BCP6_9PSEU|nr:NAD(P)-binding domain-containing protein [Lentzea xinjiangensis]SEP86766.1 3-hydroxyisobutyrate dehydrogenase [Lentzea xinjiangensis]
MTSEAITVLGLGNLGRAVAEAVAAGDLVVLVVLDHQAAQEVLRGVDVRGRTLVNVTSSTPEEAREMARWAADNGAEYLQGAVYAVPQTIGTAESSINYSGSAAMHERWRKPLELLGKSRFLGEDAGLVAGYDVAILSAMYGLLGGFLHGAAVARAAGIRATELMPLMWAWLTDMHPALVTFAEEIDSGDYAGGDSSLAMNQTGLGMLIRGTESQGVPFAGLDALKVLVDRQVAQGHGEESFARAVESFGVVAPQAMAGR